MRPSASADCLLEAIEVALRAAGLTDGIVDPGRRGGADPRRATSRDFDADADRSRPRRLRARRTPGWRAVVGRPRAATVAVPRGVRARPRRDGEGAGRRPRRRGGSRRRRRRRAGQPRRRHRHRGPGARRRLARCGSPTTIARRRGAGAGASACDSGGLATSSTTVRRWGARTAHHIIDPRDRPAGAARRGAPSASRPRPAWTRTPRAPRRSCSARRAPAWLAARGLPARLVDQRRRDADGRRLAAARRAAAA